ncbi:cytochrome c oxidase subunit II [Dongia mobilis]|jgi:cytochrome c oxidase subunit 2|uniref:cytochrome c oxidase subunit II n=1 Tax=Dongia sp. TaxID=1977262 RepID=UPI0026F28E5C
MFLKRMNAGVTRAAIATALLSATVLGGAGTALAQDVVIGASQPKQLGMQTAATSIAVDSHFFHNMVLMPIITVITIFVMLLLLWIMYRFRASKNPVPSKTTHHTGLEIAWTVIPILILIVISIPSFKLLYKQLDLPPTDLTIRAIGHQWYWSYEYPDNGNFTFDANMIQTADLKPGQLRLLETDNEVVVPVGKNIRIQITSTDVIHAWTVPSFGIKHDAVPGRVNESWFNIDADKPGLYYGQCSELCGTAHAYMPIKIRAVTEAEYNAWVAEAQTKFAKVDGVPTDDADATDVADAAPIAIQPAN